MRKRFFFVSLFLFGLAIVCIGIGLTVFFKPSSAPVLSLVSPSPFTNQIASISGEVAGASEHSVVTRVIDGDTIEVSGSKKVRYIGIDTPETVDPRKPVQCFGKSAADANRDLVLGKEVVLEKDVSETDRYGRLLRYVYITEGNTVVFVNKTLVEQGFAHASAYPPDVRYQEDFDQAEREAREGERGLWAACALASPSPTSKQTDTDSAGTVNDTQNASTNADCTIKGNISANGDKIYHVTGCGSYAKTAIDESRGEQWFCTEAEAQAAGWRKAKNC